MTTPSGYRLVDIDPSRAEEFAEVSSWAFAEDWKPEDREVFLAGMPVENARAAEVADAARGAVGGLAGVYSHFDFDTVVPSPVGQRLTVPTAGLTWVGVHPGHRRRGILRSLVADHFSRALAQGKAVSTLFAAEAEIYTRFGYGLAASQTGVRLERGAALRPVPGSEALTVRIERASHEAHAAVLAAVEARMTRPGTTLSPAGAGVRARFADPESEREGAERRRILVVEDDGLPVAFALFSRKGEWSTGRPEGVTTTEDWAAVTPAAAHRLWTVLLDLDLMSTLAAYPIAADDPLYWLLEDPRGAKADIRDNLWLRVLDLPAALQARAYAADVDVTVEVSDALLPTNAGVWRVEAAGGRAHVARADADGGAVESDGAGTAADLALDVRELGAAYLGGVSLDALAGAGLVVERTPGAVRALGTALSSPLLPLGNWFF